jgi:hypothetical protein
MLSTAFTNRQLSCPFCSCPLPPSPALAGNPLHVQARSCAHAGTILTFGKDGDLVQVAS